MRPGRYHDLSADEREHLARSLLAAMGAVHAELLEVVRAGDDAGDWERDGGTSMSAWLVAIGGLAGETTREWVRVGHALAELPALRQAYASGVMSWDQVRPATRFATGATDAALADELAGLSARQVATLARQRRPIPPSEADHPGELAFRADHRRHGWRISGFLPLDQGATVRAALERRADQLGSDPATGRWAPLAERLALALGDLAGQQLGADADPDLACIVVHTPAEVLDRLGHPDAPADQGAARSTISAPTPLPVAAAENPMLGDLALPVTTIARLLCDCRLEHHVDTADGRTVGIGTASRNIPAWLRRRVVGRDRTCRFPGCDRRIRHLHHIVRWTGADGTHGPTDATNLVGVCWQHHHLVHEGRWSISGTPESGELTFVSPTGRTLTSRPRPPASIVDRLAALTGLPLG